MNNSPSAKEKFLQGTEEWIDIMEEFILRIVLSPYEITKERKAARMKLREYLNEELNRIKDYE